MSTRFVHTIHDIPQGVWDALNKDEHPFTSYAFLSAMEDSGSLGGRTGWYPHYLVMQEEDQIVAIAPLYLKTNSWGEYVFDHGWAEGYMRAGGDYYPKLQASIPFTPATGPRLLGPDKYMSHYYKALEHYADENAYSSVHITFIPDDMRENIPKTWLVRQGYQFHWRNNKYESFDGFLAELSQKKRKTIRAERQKIKGKNIVFKALKGDELTEDVMRRFHNFYLNTIEKKWSAAYLTEDFFVRLAKAMKGQAVLITALKDDEMIAAALNFQSHDTFYGRYWGCAANYKFLHFETCYYQAIDYAIENSLRVVEAGAQGPHKVQRGYLPYKTYSLHYIAHPEFRGAVKDFLERENVVNDEEIDYFKSRSPYKS